MGIINLKTAQRSPAREALAVAIAAHAQAKERRDILVAACEWSGKSKGAVRDAKRAVELAEQGVDDANAAAVNYITSLGKRAPPTVTVREAQAAVADAEDQLHAATLAHERVEAEIPGAETTLGFREFSLRGRAQDVIREEVGPLQAAAYANVERLARELEQASQDITWLRNAGAFSGSFHTAYENFADRGQSPWDAALAALMADADAELPR